MARTLRYERGTDEFSRVVSFTDGVFAIAMTLLVVQIDIPRVDPDDLASAIGDQGALIISFFVSFLVIGYYWMAHHRFWALLARVEPGLMMLNLVYLSAIAFLPYPTGLVGEYESRPLSVMIYAASLAAASFMEVAMLSRAHRIGAFRKDPSPEAFRYALLASMSPVVVFAASIPIALYSSTLALLFWLANFPVQWTLGRYFAPEDFDDAFG